MKNNSLGVLLGFFCVMFFLFWLKNLNSNSLIIIEWEMFSCSSIVFSMSMIVDSISLSFGFVVTLISFCVFLFAVKYMEEDPYFIRFIWLLLAFVISMNMLIFSGSMFFILLGWDGLGITSFTLIIYYQSKESLSAGYQTLLINRLGDSLIIISTFSFFLLSMFSNFYFFSKELVLMSILTIASLTKSAQYPFSSWLPAAMAAPTPVSALVHSSTLVTAGVYLIIRLSSGEVFFHEISSILCFCGSVTCLLGGWAAMYENDVKKIIALSTLSQLGVMIYCLGMNMPNLALFHLYSHAMFKALLFLAAGSMLLISFGNQDLRSFGNLTVQYPFLIVFLNISGLCLIGAPFLSAFYSKHVILEMMFMSSINFVSMLIMIIASVFTVSYMFRMLKMISWSNSNISMLNISFSFSITFPLMILGMVSIFFGHMFYMFSSISIESVFIPSYYSTVVNMITILGLIMSLIKKKLNYSYLLSSMFFLTPTVKGMVKPFSKLLDGLKNLDYGWLEPNVILKNFISIPWILEGLFFWPKMDKYSFLRASMFMLIFFFVSIF